jgi:acylphosphatase
VCAWRAVISGRVQGVGFRESLRRRAETLAVAGWARNRPDGTVEAWAEGSPDGVDTLLRYARSGPPMAAVEDVAIEDATPAGLRSFEVR